MATTLYLRNASFIVDTGDYWYTYPGAITTAGTGTASISTLSAYITNEQFLWSGKEYWVSPPLSADVLIMGNISVSIQASETNMAANQWGYIKVFRLKPDGTATEAGDGYDNAEFGTSNTQMDWVVYPHTYLTFSAGDRIGIQIWTMPSDGTGSGGYNSILYYDGTVATGTYDSKITFTETLSFSAESQGVIPRPGAGSLTITKLSPTVVQWSTPVAIPVDTRTLSLTTYSVAIYGRLITVPAGSLTQGGMNNWIAYFRQGSGTVSTYNLVRKYSAETKTHSTTGVTYTVTKDGAGAVWSDSLVLWVFGTNFTTTFDGIKCPTETAVNWASTIDLPIFGYGSTRSQGGKSYIAYTNLGPGDVGRVNIVHKLTYANGTTSEVLRQTDPHYPSDYFFNTQQHASVGNSVKSWWVGNYYISGYDEPTTYRKGEIFNELTETLSDYYTNLYGYSNVGFVGFSGATKGYVLDSGNSTSKLYALDYSTDTLSVAFATISHYLASPAEPDVDTAISGNGSGVWICPQNSPYSIVFSDFSFATETFVGNTSVLLSVTSNLNAPGKYDPYGLAVKYNVVPVGSLGVAGSVPGLSFCLTYTPYAGTRSLAGYVPSIVTAYTPKVLEVDSTGSASFYSEPPTLITHIGNILPVAQGTSVFTGSPPGSVEVHLRTLPLSLLAQRGYVPAVSVVRPGTIQNISLGEPLPDTSYSNFDLADAAEGFTCAPGKGSVGITCTTPSISIATPPIEVPIGGLVCAGASPEFRVYDIIYLGFLGLTGRLPTVVQTVSHWEFPGCGAINFNSLAGSADINLRQPGAGSLSITGHAPETYAAPYKLDIPATSLSIIGSSVVKIATETQPPIDAAALGFVGNEAILYTAIILPPIAVGLVSITRQIPFSDRSNTPGLGSLPIQGHTPIKCVAKAISVGIGGMSIYTPRYAEGYFIGGGISSDVYNKDVVTAGTRTILIDKIDFSTEIVAAHYTGLGVGYANSVGFSSGKKGYTAGGVVEANAVGVFIAIVVDSIQTISYGLGILGELSAVLSDTMINLAAVESVLAGYVCTGRSEGGTAWGGCNKLLYSTETKSNVNQSFTGQYAAVGMSGATKGYIGSGRNGGTFYPAMQSFTYASETVATTSITLQNYGLSGRWGGQTPSIGLTGCCYHLDGVIFNYGSYIDFATEAYTNTELYGKFTVGTYSGTVSTGGSKIYTAGGIEQGWLSPNSCTTVVARHNTAVSIWDEQWLSYGLGIRRSNFPGVSNWLVQSDVTLKIQDAHPKPGPYPLSFHSGSGGMGYFTKGDDTSFDSDQWALAFYTLTTRVTFMEMVRGRGKPNASSSTSTGYFLGGNSSWYPESPNVAITESFADAFKFHTEVGYALTFTLAVPCTSAVGGHSSIRGYVCGGWDGGANMGSTEIQGVRFDTEAYVNPSNTLTYRQVYGGSASTPLALYILGGYKSKSIYKLIFSTETSTSVNAELLAQTEVPGGVASSASVYICRTGAVHLTEKLSIATESTEILSINLATDTSSSDGVTDGLSGYFSGIGNGAPYRVINFSTDTFSALHAYAYSGQAASVHTCRNRNLGPTLSVKLKGLPTFTGELSLGGSAEEGIGYFGNITGLKAVRLTSETYFSLSATLGLSNIEDTTGAYSTVDRGWFLSGNVTYAIRLVFATNTVNSPGYSLSSYKCSGGMSKLAGYSTALGNIDYFSKMTFATESFENIATTYLHTNDLSKIHLNSADFDNIFYTNQMGSVSGLQINFATDALTYMLIKLDNPLVYGGYTQNKYIGVTTGVESFSPDDSRWIQKYNFLSYTSGPLSAMLSGANAGVYRGVTGGAYGLVWSANAPYQNPPNWIDRIDLYTETLSTPSTGFEIKDCAAITALSIPIGPLVITAAEGAIPLFSGVAEVIGRPPTYLVTYTPVDIAVDCSSLAIAGQSLSILAEMPFKYVDTSNVDLLLSGYDVWAAVGLVSISTPVGVLGIAAYAGTVNIAISAEVGAVVVTGNTPLSGINVVSISPSYGVLAATGARLYAQNSGVQKEELSLDMNYRQCGATVLLELQSLVNTARAAIDLPPVVINVLPGTVDVAQKHSLDMANSGVFAHESSSFPDGWQTIAQRQTRLTYASGFAENLAGEVYPYSDPIQLAADAFDTWWNSPPHKAVMLYDWGNTKPIYMLLGAEVGIITGYYEEYSWYLITQNFFQLRDPIMQSLSQSLVWDKAGADMSFTILSWDKGAYAHATQQSVVSYSIIVEASHEVVYGCFAAQQHSADTYYSVSVDHTSEYTQTSALTLQHQAGYNVQEYLPVSGQNEALFSSQVSSAISCIYSSSEAVVKSHTASYEANTQVEAYLETPYQSYATVTSALHAYYQGSLQVARDFGSPYTANAPVSSSHKLLWDDKPSVSSSHKADWGTSLPVRQSFNTPYHMAPYLARALSALWESSVAVTRALTAQWEPLPDVAAGHSTLWGPSSGVARDFNAPYYLSPVVARSSTAFWDSSSEIAKSHGSLWGSMPEIAKPHETLWGDSISVRKGFETPYRLSAVISKAFDTPWEPSYAIAKDNAATWGDMLQAGKQHQASWEGSVQVTRGLDSPYYLSAVLYKAIEARYDSSIEVAKSFLMEYGDSSVVLKGFLAGYYMSPGVSKQFEARYEPGVEVAKSFSAEYGVNERVSRVFFAPYNLSPVVSKAFEARYEPGIEVAKAFSAGYGDNLTVSKWFSSPYYLSPSIAKAFEAQYQSNLTVTRQSSTEYGVSEEITRAFNAPYYLSPTIAKAFSALYGVNVTVYGGFSAPYYLSPVIYKAFEAAYQDNGMMSKGFTAGYEPSIQVTRGFNTPYTLAADLFNSFTALYGSNSSVTAAFSASYQSNLTIAHDFNAPYYLAPYLAKTSTALWGSSYALVKSHKATWEEQSKVVKSHNAVWGDGVSARKSNTAIWSMNLSLSIGHEAKYTTTYPISTQHSSDYYLLANNPVKQSMVAFYSLISTGVDVSDQDEHPLYLRHYDTGVVIDIVSAQLECDEGDVFWTARIVLSDYAEYNQLAKGETIELVLWDDSYLFLVDTKSLSRTDVAPELTITGVGIAATYTKPIADPITMVVSEAMNASVIAELVLGTAIDWQMHDWMVPAYRFAVSNITPMDAAKTIVEAAGGLLESEQDGSFIARYKFPVSPSKFYEPETVIQHILTDGEDNVSVQESSVRGTYYDKVRVSDSDVTQADKITFKAEEGFIDRGILSVYPYPWRTDLFVVHTSGEVILLSEIGVVQETITETVEFTFGSASTSQPILEVSELVWFSVSLGGIAFEPRTSELKTSTTINGGFGVVSITYVSEHIEYFTQAPIGSVVQYLVEENTGE